MTRQTGRCDEKRILADFSLFSLCLLLLAACSPSSEDQKIAAGKEVYINQCSHCHQPEGQGYAQVFPHLPGNPIVILADPEPVIEIVLHGRGSMPAYIDSLTGEERAQVISYIRNAWHVLTEGFGYYLAGRKPKVPNSYRASS